MPGKGPSGKDWKRASPILQKDYRDLTGQFDKLVSIGMFEHVGKGFVPVFMEKTRNLLRRGGVGVLHTIGKETRYAR
jgi:cyclopropane-fatty-acyl-phospholipid synthase